MTDGSNDGLYQLLKNTPSNCRLFVPRCYNGDIKIEKAELARELWILKVAGIEGVEINPISFPSNSVDMGIPFIEWLSVQ